MATAWRGNGSTLADIKEAEESCERLRDALTAAGITLPSLAVDVVSCTSGIIRPLLDLGGCNLTTADRLTAALTRETDGRRAGGATVGGR